MKNKGFTIIEFVIVILIIAILVGMLIPAINMVREGAKKAKSVEKIIGTEVKIKNKDFKGTIMSVVQTRPRTIYRVRIYKGENEIKMYEEVQFFDTELEGLPE